MTVIEFFRISKAILTAKKLLLLSRFSSKYFTRNRRMGFVDAVIFMLDMRKTALQNRLNEFFAKVKGEKPISQQSFSDLREKFSHRPFEELLRGTVKAQYSMEHSNLATWNGKYVLAIDGSYLQLPLSAQLAADFGVRGGGNRPSAGISVLYDVLNGWAIDPIITGTDMNEREECEKHMAFITNELSCLAKNCVILLDRGYPSQELLARFENMGLKFLTRCKNSFNNDIRDLPLGSSIYVFKNGIEVKIVKFSLPSGEIETLITNLLDSATFDLITLYKLRWNIETAYMILKRELCVEKFSGKTFNSILQDFWASMYLINATAVVQAEADHEVQRKQASSDNKLEYKARKSNLIVSLRDKFIFCVLFPDKNLMQHSFEQLILLIARTVSPIRPNRASPRHFAPNQDNNFNLKSHL